MTYHKNRGVGFRALPSRIRGIPERAGAGENYSRPYVQCSDTSAINFPPLPSSLKFLPVSNIEQAEIHSCPHNRR